MSNDGPTWSEMVGQCSELGLLAKKLYVVFTKPVNGIGPIMEVLDEHLAYQNKIQNTRHDAVVVNDQRGQVPVRPPLDARGGKDFQEFGLSVLGRQLGQQRAWCGEKRGGRGGEKKRVRVNGVVGAARQPEPLKKQHKRTH